MKDWSMEIYAIQLTVHLGNRLIFYGLILEVRKETFVLLYLLMELILIVR